MIIGQTILSEVADPGVVYFTPWFPRGGNMLVTSCETIAEGGDFNGTDPFTVQVETKKSEDGDDAAESVGSAVSISTTPGDFTEIKAGAALGAGSSSTGLRDLVRFKITLKSSAINTLCWVHFRILNPSWLSN